MFMRDIHNRVRISADLGQQRPRIVGGALFRMKIGISDYRFKSLNSSRMTRLRIFPTSL